VGLGKKHSTMMQKMYITTGLLTGGVHYIFKTCTNTQNPLWYKTLLCKIKKRFSQVLLNFGRIWSVEPDYKCKFRNSKNKAQ